MLTLFPGEMLLLESSFPFWCQTDLRITLKLINWTEHQKFYFLHWLISLVSSPPPLPMCQHPLLICQFYKCNQTYVLLLFQENCSLSEYLFSTVSSSFSFSFSDKLVLIMLPLKDAFKIFKVPKNTFSWFYFL